MSSNDSTHQSFYLFLSTKLLRQIKGKVYSSTITLLKQSFHFISIYKIYISIYNNMHYYYPTKRRTRHIFIILFRFIHHRFNFHNYLNCFISIHGHRCKFHKDHWIHMCDYYQEEPATSKIGDYLAKIK